MPTHFKKTILLLFLFAGAQWVTAQIIQPTNKWERRKQAAGYFEHLSTAGLVVRLPTSHRKIAKLTEMLDSNLVAEENRPLFEQRLAQTKRITLQRQRALVAAFEAHYDHGPVYFMADSSYVQFLADPTAVVFWNTQLQPDPNISGPGANGLVFHTGYRQPNSTMTVDQIVVTDRQRREPVRPFPRASSNVATAFTEDPETYEISVQKWSIRLAELELKLRKWNML
ncbi:MAG: hypothetical protein AAGJ82_12485 [Bacteroidota bacterium]